MDQIDTPRNFEAAKASLVGDRQCNQDRCLFLGNDDTVLLGLADGLGGHPRGEVAAQLLMDVCESMFRQAAKPLHDPEQFMLQCIGKAHNAIIQFGRRQQPPIAPRTTAVLATIQGGIAYWAHVGDSRLYFIRHGQVLAQTRDHSLVRFVRESAHEVSRPRSSLTRCLGGMPQPPTTTCGPPTLLQQGDAIVLCSDVLWGQISDQALVAALGDARTPVDTSLPTLVRRAAAMPGSDNVTAVELRWQAPAAVQSDQSETLEPPRDPRVERAIRHLRGVLKKISTSK